MTINKPLVQKILLLGQIALGYGAFNLLSRLTSIVRRENGTTAFVLAHVLMLAFSVALLWLIAKGVLRSIPIHWPTRQELTESLVLFAGVVGMSLMGMAVLDLQGDWRGASLLAGLRMENTDPWSYGLSLALLFFAVGVAAPIAEELVYRGFLYHGLQRLGLPKITSAVIISLLFAIVHGLDVLPTISLFALSAMLIWSLEDAKTIALPMMIHGVYNTAALLMVLLAR